MKTLKVKDFWNVRSRRAKERGREVTWKVELFSTPVEGRKVEMSIPVNRSMAVGLVMHVHTQHAHARTHTHTHATAKSSRRESVGQTPGWKLGHGVLVVVKTITK